MANTPVKVTTIGLDERSVATLQYAFENRCNNNCAVSAPNVAQVALIDFDLKDAATLLDGFRKAYPEIPVIGMCRDKLDDEGVVPLFKPFSVNNLAESIIALAEATRKDEPVNKQNTITSDKIEKAMRAVEQNRQGIVDSLKKRAEEKKNKTAVNRNLHGKTEEITFELQRFLLGEVIKAEKEAEKQDKIAILTCWGDKTIIINTENDQIITNLNDSQIRNLAITPFDGDMSHLASPVTARYADKNDNELLIFEKQAGSRKISREVFMWNLGVLTCRGRIPSDISPDERVFVKRWPNLTRMVIPNNVMRIISYWIHQPSSVTEMIEKLSLPEDEIYTVFTASYAAGIADVNRRQADELLEVADIREHKKRGLFSSIIGKLRKQDEAAKKSA